MNATITPPATVRARLAADREGQRHALDSAVARLTGEIAMHEADSIAEHSYVAGLERALRVISTMRDEVAP